MKRKLGFVILPTMVFVAALSYVAPKHMPTYAAPLVALWTTILVVVAMFSPEPKSSKLDKHLPPVSNTDRAEASLPEPWKTFYDKTTQMHIDTDKGMYQIITVFVGASLLVLSWVVGTAGDQSSITPEKIAFIGSLAVTLVGIATILKHRLRHYNKLREIYLRRLEALSGGIGPHTFISAASKTKWSLSFHEAVDLYYFIYAFVWVLLYCWKS